MTTPQQDGYNLGQAYGTISINASGVQRGIQDAQRQFNNGIQSMGQSIQGFGQQIQMLGANLALLTAPIAAIGTQGIRTAASFQDSLTMIQARTGATAETMEMVRETALQLGADTMFSAQQVSDAFLNLLTAGLTMEESLATLPQVLSAAAAGSLDLGTAADIVTNVMTSFGLSAEQTGDIVQAMSAAAAASPASMLEIGQAMQQVGGIAQSYGVTMDETAAIMAIFAQNGIRGSEAGTQLRSMLRNMTSDADPTVAAWEKIGVSMFDAEGNMRNLDDVLADMRVGLAGLTQQEQIDVLQQLGGAYGQIGLSALLGSDGVGAMADSMAAQADVADVAETMMGTFNGAMESLRGSIETLMITAFTPFIEMLTPMINRLIEIVNAVSDWVDANQEIVQPILKVLAVVIAFVPVLLAVGTAISAFGGIISILGTALAFILSPIGLLIAAVVALGAAWATNFMGIRDAINGFIDTLKGLWTAIQEGGLSGGATFIWDNVISPMINQINAYVGSGQLWDDLKALGTSIFDGILAGLPVIAEWVTTNILDPLRNTFGPAIQNTDWNQVALDIVNGIGTALTTLASWATWIFDNLLMPIVSNIATAVASVDWLQVGSTILSAIGTVFTTLIDWGVWIIDNVLTPLISNAATAIENIDWYGVGAGIVNAIGAALTALFDFVAWIINSIFNPVTDNAEGAAGQIDWISVGITIFNGIAAALSAAFDFVQWVYENIMTPLVLGAADAIAQTDWSAVGDGIMDAIGNALGDIGQWAMDNIVTPLQNAVSNFDLGNFVSMGGDFIGEIGHAIGFAEGGMVEAVVGERGPERVLMPSGSQVQSTSQSSMPSIGTLIIQANTEAGGAAGMRGALAEWDKVINERNLS